MAETRAPDLALRLLRDHLRRDAPVREASIARYMSGVAFIATLVALSLGPTIGWGLAGGICALTGAIAGYYFLLLRALKTGWYHPAIPWVNVSVEVSAPALIITLDLLKQGPLYAVVAPPT